MLIHMSAPGEAFVTPWTDGKPAVSEQTPWFAVSMRGADLVLERVTTSRQPDWNVEQRALPNPLPDTPKLEPVSRLALAMPATAMFGFRVESADAPAPALKTGVHASLLAQPVLLHDRWSTEVSAGGKRWIISTESERRKDRAMLSGSLSVVARTAEGQKTVLLPPAHGMVFERQELLWLGALRTGSGFDLLVKRTRITGQIDYVLKIGDSISFANVDPDRAHTYFASGVEAYEELASHVAQRRPRPEGKFGQAAFSISEENWNKGVQDAEKDALPKLLFDRQLALNTEKIRFSIEYLPTATMTRDESGSSANSSREGPVLVKVAFRGKTQTLLLPHVMDGSDFRAQVGMLNGEPAVQIAFYPHYNNSFEYYWVWDEAERRFMRLSVVHKQGC